VTPIRKPGMPAWRWRNVPVPEPHLGGLALAMLLQLLLPWRMLPEAWVGHAIGWPVAVVGLSIAAQAVIAVADLDIEHPSKVVERGAYGFSRNPMYLGWTLVYVGVAFVVNVAWAVALLPAVLLLTHLVVLHEERYLEGRFGGEFRDYMSRVHRYI
jgi:protein-S-isoprenylcysteine O-methyltransferase Ste14